MSAEGKHSPFTFKTFVYSAVGFLLTWGATKLLDTYFDMTLLADAKGWVLASWKWLNDVEVEPRKNWYMVSNIVFMLLLIYAIIHIYRLYTSTLESLNKSEASKAVPTAPELTRTQIRVLHSLASVAQSGFPSSRMLLVSGAGIDGLELDIALEQLAEGGFVQFSSATLNSVQTPSLALKGKEFVVAHRKNNNKLADQKKKAAKTEGNLE